jgi:hypothetical protein
VKDGDTGEYKGVTYVAQDAPAALCCRGCAGHDIGVHYTEFCNAMPNCTACDRRDKRDVIFVEQRKEVQP